MHWQRETLPRKGQKAENLGEIITFENNEYEEDTETIGEKDYIIKLKITTKRALEMDMTVTSIYIMLMSL